MQFLEGSSPTFDLTYSDVFLVPKFSDSSSRMDVDLTPPENIGTTLPVVVSNMTAVAGKRMAEAVTRRGGLVVIPQDIPLDKLKDTVEYIQTRDHVFETPISLRLDNTVQKALSLIHKRAHGAVVVTDDKDVPVGVFTESDAKGYDLFTPLSEVMSTDVVVFKHTEKLETMYKKLDDRRFNYAPVTKNGKLIGAVTKKGILRSTMFTPALNAKKQLMTSVAVGINGDVKKKTEQLLKLGVDVLVADTAHGHQKKMIDAIKAIRSVAKNTPIVAGNVVTAQSTADLIDAGADIVKVGVGPGAMCTTRMMTGVGRPQFSAALECAAVARSAGKHIWADGGIRYPRDVALALAAGSSSTMYASWFAGTYESVADMQIDSRGNRYKESFGMASKRAVTERNKSESALETQRKQFFEEGISSSKMYLRPDSPGAEDILDQVAAGVRSAMTYSGAKNIDELHEKAVVGIQSSSGYSEGRPVATSWDT